MKRRNRMSRRATSPRARRSACLPKPASASKRVGRSSSLEDRLVFSAQPLQIQTVSYSNDTPEGAYQTYLNELAWSNYQLYQSSLQGQAGAAGGAMLTDSTASNLVTYSLPNDPLFASQWHLLNTGQEVGSSDFPPLYGVAGEDINVVPVWNLGYTGEGVVVAVIDSGVQITHPDLVGNIDPLRRYNAITGTTNVSPDLFDPGEWPRNVGRRFDRCHLE